MDDEKIISIPLVCKENSDQRFIKIIKWLVILLIISNIMWGASWVAYWFSPETAETITQDCDDNGICNFIGNDGEIYGSEASN